MKRTWTDEQKQFLRDVYGRWSYADIAAALGKTADQVKSQASNMKITRTRKWPDRDLEYLRMAYPGTPTAEIAQHLGRHLSAVYSTANKLGLNKSEAFLNGPLSGRLTAFNAEERGGHSRFQKGQKAWNKGVKGVCGVQVACRKTQFKKGERTGIAVEKYQPVGAERVSKDGYLERKINDDMPCYKRWKAVHRILWEEVNGPVPKGHHIAFKDGNKANITLDNLECISRIDWMKRHTFHNYPEPVKQQIHILAGFKRRLNRYAEKQDRRPAEPAV